MSDNETTTFSSVSNFGIFLTKRRLYFTPWYHCFPVSAKLIRNGVDDGIAKEQQRKHGVHFRHEEVEPRRSHASAVRWSHGT